MFGAKAGIGFGIDNPINWSLSNLIFPEVEIISYINVSEDCNIALISIGSYPGDSRQMNQSFISLRDEFSPVNIGTSEVYDTNFPDQFSLYMTSSHGVSKLDLKSLNENIFTNGFEGKIDENVCNNNR